MHGLLNRRQITGLAAAGAAGLLLDPISAAATTGTLLTRKIPSSGEAIPILGVGTWITFNIGKDPDLRATRVKVLEEFFAGGGGLIDSSPMYGAAEEVIGYCLRKLPPQKKLFTATKVWTVSKWMGERQMKASERLWGEKQFDLIQIHNLLDWESHLETLNTWKASGRLRYSGITTSHGRRHGDFAKVMAGKKLDFAQLTYNIVDREAENRLLPLARERGMAVIVNRPFQRGALIERLRGKPLPPWAGEIGCDTWPQFLLKFIISHPAVTCAIPATSNPAHMRENLIAGRGSLPGEAMRNKMSAYVRDL